MNTKHDLANRIQRVYLTLQAGNTLAASFIFGHQYALPPRRGT